MKYNPILVFQVTLYVATTLVLLHLAFTVPQDQRKPLLPIPRYTSSPTSSETTLAPTTVVTRLKCMATGLDATNDASYVVTTYKGGKAISVEIVLVR